MSTPQSSSSNKPSSSRSPTSQISQPNAKVAPSTTRRRTAAPPPSQFLRTLRGFACLLDGLISRLDYQPKPPFWEPRLRVNAQVGSGCVVRGIVVESASVDRWVGGVVLDIVRGFTFPDGVTTDKYTVKFRDESAQDGFKVGVFFTRWNEIADLTPALRTIPPMSGRMIIDLLQTRMVWTPLLANSKNNDALLTPFSGIVWTPAFIENVINDDTPYKLDVKFLHFRGGMAAPQSTRIRIGSPRCLASHVWLSGHLSGRRKKLAEYETSFTDILRCARPLYSFSVDDLMRSIPSWGPEAGTTYDFDLPWFWCSCGTGDRVPCRKIGALNVPY